MLRILTRSVSEGYTPGPSLTLWVSMTCFVAGVIFSTPDPVPRAVPWAGMLLPLRGEIQKAQLQNAQAKGIE